jgi:urease accessory protein
MLASTPPPGVSRPGIARLGFRRTACRDKTVVATAFAASPLRLLTPANHGNAAWVFLASLGGGLLDGDRIDVEVDVGEGASALLGTQASTKVYRSAGSATGSLGSSQRLSARVAAGAVLTVVPDPVVCFAEARYEQAIEIELAPGASLWLIDGYSCGRSARGERWAFSRYASRTTIVRAGARSIVDATRLDPAEGPLVDRMGRFDIVLSLLVVGPRFARVREAMLASWSSPAPPRSGAADGSEAPARGDSAQGDSARRDSGQRDSAQGDSGPVAVVAVSPLGGDACILRVAGERFESASRALRSSFAALASVLGDDPFARKW